ncbi:MAG: LCP family protein [Aggregatilineales bacterium]
MSDPRYPKPHARPLDADRARPTQATPTQPQAHARPFMPESREVRPESAPRPAPRRPFSLPKERKAQPLSPSSQESNPRGLARERSRRRQTGDRGFDWRSSIQVNWIHLVIGLAIVGIVGVATVGAFAARGNSPPPIPTAGSAAQNATAGPTPTLGIDIKPWNGKGRFTVLLMGVDARPGEDIATSRTDVMMLMSIDPVTHTGAMLSIPRDLFVPIPGESDMQRINSAFEIGELKQPGGGAKLAMQTVQYNFGIPINSYLIFTFQAVMSLIDAVGGVDIDVPAPIDDPLYPDMNDGYDPLHIPAGHIHMDGTLALKYARTRHGDSDFERTHRQQQVILAVRDKVVHLNMLPQLVAQAPTLWTQLQGNFATDLTLDQILSLAVYARDIAPGSIQHATLEGQYVRPIQWQGDTVLTPDRTLLAALMTQVFGADYAR